MPDTRKTPMTDDLAARRAQKARAAAYEPLRRLGLTDAEIERGARMSAQDLDRWLRERWFRERGYPPLIAAAMAAMTDEELDRTLAAAEAQRAAGLRDLCAERIKRAVAGGADIEDAIVGEFGKGLRP